MVRSRLVRLSASILLSTVLMLVSTALAVPAKAAPGTSGGTVLGAATAAPSATAVRADPRVPAGPSDLDLLGGQYPPHRSPERVAGWPVPASASGPHEAGDARRYQGRAPPHTR